MESRRYLRCLGQPALFAATGEPIRFRTRKHLALLVYLAVEPRRPHSRERLAELLWPTGSRTEARHSLATALSILRPRVGSGVLETDRERVTMLPGSLGLDLDRLAAGDILGSEYVAPLEVAAFLDGFDIQESGEFALWKDRQQARLLPAIKEGLIVLIDRCRRTGDSRQIEQLADRMLALDELSEEAIRAKMEARAFAGDRLTALRIFEEWKQKVGEELGASPSDLVEGMAVRLRRRGWERTVPSAIPAVPTDQWRGRAFIGRGTEYRLLYEAWEGMQQGVAGHRIVIGDSGIGKTTLVNRLTTAAGLEGAVIGRVQCYDLEREIPYATVGNLILGLLERPGVSATPPEALSEIARTVPDVRRRFPTIPPPEESHGETARIRLTEAFLQMLLAISEEHPVILFVDDVHLADDASLAVLHLVLRRSGGHPIMMLLAARPGELTRSPHASRLREATALGFRDIELRPMTEEESSELLTTLIETDHDHPGPAIRRTLLSAAAGFPMVLELLVQDWQAHGGASLALAVGAMTTDFTGNSGPSITYRHVLSRLIASLDLPAQNVLNIAAVLGHRLSDLSMYGVLDITPGQAVIGLSELAQLRLVRDGSQGLEFTNELSRAHAYASIPASLRRSVHSSVAERLLAIPADGEPAAGLEVAWHCIRAGRAEEAIPHLLRGAREAINRGAPHEAERAISSALPVLGQERRAEAVLLLVELLQEQGAWQDSLDRIQELGPEDLGELKQDFFVLSAVARQYLSAVSAEAAYEGISELTAIIRTCSRNRTRVRASKAVAQLLERHRDEHVSREVLRYVEAIPVSDLDADEAAELGFSTASLLYQCGETDKSLAEASAAVCTMQSRNACNLLTVQLHTGLAALRMRQGEYAEATGHLEQALSLAQRLGNDAVISRVIANICLCLARLGRYNEQAVWAARINASDAAELTGFSEVQLTYSLGLGLAMRHRPQQALECISKIEARLVGRIPHWIIQAWCLWKADVLFICGRRNEAYESAETGIGAEGTLFATSFAGPYARWLSTIAKKKGLSWAGTALEGLYQQIDVLDALDQADVLVAKMRYDGEESGETAAKLSRLNSMLARLPVAIRSQLKALEMLRD